MATPPIQDFPPKEGFPNTIRYARSLPRRGPSGAVVLAAVFGIMTYGFMRTAEGNLERRELRHEKTWARINLIPLLEAELDRDLVRRESIVAQREAELMKNKKDWIPMDLKAPIVGIGKNGQRNDHSAEPVYHTKRYVRPSLIFLPPSEEKNVLEPQWWRGSKVLTKNPPYQDRPDFSKQYPIGHTDLFGYDYFHGADRRRASLKRMIFAFVLDTSASMNRLFSRNLSYLEASKYAIEHFIKFHSKAPKSHEAANFIFVTYDTKAPIKSVDGAKEVLTALAHVRATDSSDAGSSFSALFEYLNALRITGNGDIPGKGRFPALQNSTLIFWLTDGTSFSSFTNVENQINIPLGKSSQSSGFLEPFRWEQRLYTILLGDQIQNPLIGALADSMGGQTWKISSIPQLAQCIDNCFETRHPNTPPFQPMCHIEGVSVVLRLSNNSEARHRLFLYANKTVSSTFPIPESFWPEISNKRASDHFSLFSKRTAHPHIYVSTKDDICPIYDGFPCERLSMEQISFTQELMKRPRNSCWLAYVENSSLKPGLGQPFGFFKVTKNGQSVNFYILPYNFKRLFSLLNAGALFKTASQVPAKFTNSFISYLQETPPYYWSNIKKGMEMVRLSYLWPSKIPSPDILLEIDNVNGNLVNIARTLMERTRMTAREQSNFQSQDKLGKESEIIQNIFDIPKENIEKQYMLSIGKVQLRKSHSKSIISQEELDNLHSVPIEVMGQYKEKMDELQKNSPRDPFEDEESVKRRNDTLFGNPYFRVKKSVNLNKQQAQDYPSIESPDSVMNEAEEEASHEFEKELKKTNETRLLTRKKRYLGKNGAVPYLYKKALLSFPSFKGLRWNHLANYEYSYIAGLGDLAVESVVKEFELTSATPSNAAHSPDTEAATLKSRFSENVPELDVHSTVSSEAMDDEIGGSTDFMKVDSMIMENDWKYIRKRIHTCISKWPKYYDDNECINIVNEVLNPSDERYEQKLNWIVAMAFKFKHHQLVQYLKNFKEKQSA